jgi:hypothetical protein
LELEPLFAMLVMLNRALRVSVVNDIHRRTHGARMCIRTLSVQQHRKFDPSDTEAVFAHISSKELMRAMFVFGACGQPQLMKLGMPVPRASVYWAPAGLQYCV